MNPSFKTLGISDDSLVYHENVGHFKYAELHNWFIYWLTDSFSF